MPVAADVNQANLDTFAAIGTMLTNMGLGGLFNWQAGGTPSGWLWDQITSGVDDQATILINLEQTPVYQARYGIINEFRKRAAAGEAVHVPTEAEVREYEQKTASVMRQAGLPAFMYDNVSDMQQLMRQGLSAVEVEQRVGQVWDRVQNTDPFVREQFGQFFGINGDAALAAAFLDPTRTMANIDRMSRTAYTAGMGRRLGVNVDQATADRIAGSPTTDAGIYQDLTTTAGITGSGILTETLSETQDLTDKTAIDATFFGSGAASSDLEKRAIERQAARAAVPGGAVRTHKGLTGAGIASI